MNISHNKKNKLENSNIIVSGWPSSGGSTQARLLVLILDMNYIYAGGVLKYWIEKMGYDPKTNEINLWAEKYHEVWDYIWENYIALKIKSTRRTLLEGKTAGFLIKSNNIFKIFIKASLKARSQRSKLDKRKEDIEKRDHVLRRDWTKRFNVDIFDEKLINKKYNLIIDTSELGIEETALIIIKELGGYYKNFDNKQATQKLEMLMQEYEKDPDILMDMITKKNLMLQPSAIFKEIKSKHPELIRGIPSEARTVFD